MYRKCGITNTILNQNGNLYNDNKHMESHQGNLRQELSWWLSYFGMRNRLPTKWFYDEWRTTERRKSVSRKRTTKTAETIKKIQERIRRKRTNHTTKQFFKNTYFEVVLQIRQDFSRSSLVLSSKMFKTIFSSC